MKHNVCIRVIDEPTGKVVSEHIGHNAATNSMLNGIGQFLLGGSVTGQGQFLQDWIPQYISLGVMGMRNQEEDEEGLPAGVGDLYEGSSFVEDEERQFIDYLQRAPGFGSDGYDDQLMNDRRYAGLGPVFADRDQSLYGEGVTAGCELISPSFLRSKITYRNVIPEYEAEYPKTIDVVFSALISTGALKQFREPGKSYIFISEAGLWSKADWESSGSNGLLAGYRIVPPDESNWDMSVPENRKILKQNIIRVGTNQVAQIIWKVQLGGLEQMGGLDKLYPQEGYMKWKIII